MEHWQAMTGTLYGIGVGPGDAELITLKGYRLLRAAPVIAYPTLEDGASLAREIAAPHLPGGQTEVAIPIPLSVDLKPAEAAYDAGAQALGGHLAAGRDVAMICEGDPFFYGSFMYLFQRLAGRFAVRVVPGVSSLTACAAQAGWPLASRDDVLSVIPAPLAEADLARRLENCDAAAIVKVGRHFDKVRRVLAAQGLTDRARYVERATMANQRILTLDAVGDGVQPYFSMILVHKRGGAAR